MGRERHDSWHERALLTRVNNPREHGLMPAMYTIEVADGQRTGGCAKGAGKVPDDSNRFHV